jgi:hypothetical protein
MFGPGGSVWCARFCAILCYRSAIYVARQSAEYGRDGITKASFGVADLLGETETHVARR